MRSVNSSITGLVKSAETFKTMLEKTTLRVKLDVFRTGKGGTEHFGPSYIHIVITGDDGFRVVDEKVHAGGYGEIVTWKAFKTEILTKLNAVV